MFDILNSYLKKEPYYIIIMNNNIYIKNYNRIINIDREEIIIDIDNKVFNIKGKNFSLNKSTSKEIMFYGNIESVKEI